MTAKLSGIVNEVFCCLPEAYNLTASFSAASSSSSYPHRHHHLSLYLSIYLSIYLWLYSPLLDLGRFFSILIRYTVGRNPWTGDQPVARPLPTHRTSQTQSKRTQTCMPWVGFEPTIPALSERRFFMPTTTTKYDHILFLLVYTECPRNKGQYSGRS
jgi:hypothetical protein